jgi:hypothetical protein
MTRAIVIQLAPQEIRAVVARAEHSGMQVDDVISITIEGTDLAAAAKKFAGELEVHQPHKAEMLMAVPSSAIKWQYVSLPPCPPEDLPALVTLQLDLEPSRDDEAIGYDFLPFVGSEDRPQRVLGMMLRVAELARVRNFSRIAGLKAEHLVPLAVGWVELGKQLDPVTETTQILVAIQGKEAAIWAMVAGKMALIRQVTLVEELESGKAAAGVAAQLRRTMLSLSQEGILADEAEIGVLGEPFAALQDLAGELRGQFTQSVRTLSLPPEVILPQSATAIRAELLPLLGIAWQAVQGQPPVLDFLHPRKPPEPKSNRRTLVLAGVAAGLLAAMIGWQMYANLNEPLWATEKLQDELYTINQELEPLQAEERDAARIREWLDASPNLLTELAALGEDWRPETFDSQDFAIANDGVLKRVDLTNRRLILTGNVASAAAVQPLENRLRDTGHRVRREQSDPATDGGQYPWQVQIVVDVVDGSPVEGQP